MSTDIANYTATSTKPAGFVDFMLHLVPTSIVDALAKNDILQILVFSLFAGVALSAIGERGQALVKGADALAEMMLQVTGYVMRYAPIAVFGALANVVAASGLDILGTYLELLVEFYLSLVLLWVILRAENDMMP